MKRSLRWRIFAALERHEETDQLGRAFHILLVSAICLSLSGAVIETVPQLQIRPRYFRDSIEWFAVTVLTIEYVFRIWTAVDHAGLRRRDGFATRLRFATSASGLIDLIAIAPFWLSLIIDIDPKTVLVLSFLRALKLTRYSAATMALLDSLNRERRALRGCVVLLVSAALIAAAFMHLAEYQAQPKTFGTIPDALWWAIVTLGTVGYGDVVPITPAGRLIASITIFAGLLIVALPIGIVASSFANEVHRREFLVTWGVVARIPLFQELSASEIAEVMTMLRASRASAGSVITRSGEPAHSMYLIVEGEIELRLKEKTLRLGAGNFFGEVAVLKGLQRSATAVAVTGTRLLSLEASDLFALMERQPELAARIKQAAHSKTGQHAS